MNSNDEYPDLLAEYDNLVSTATDISTRAAGRPVDSGRLFAASQLFTNLCGRSITLLRLLPQSRLDGARFEMWDTASIAVIVRTIMETSHAFDYLAVEEVADAERDARFRLVELHYLCEYRSILIRFGAKPEDLSAKTLEIEQLQRELTRNEYFAALPAHARRRAGTGETPFFKTNAEMASRFGFSDDTFRAVYKWISNYAHSHPFAFIRVSNDRGRGLDNPADRGYICRLIEIANGYVAGCIRGYCSLFVDLRDSIPRDRWAIIEARTGNAIV